MKSAITVLCIILRAITLTAKKGEGRNGLEVCLKIRVKLMTEAVLSELRAAVQVFSSDRTSNDS